MGGCLLAVVAGSGIMGELSSSGQALWRLVGESRGSWFVSVASGGCGGSLRRVANLETLDAIQLNFDMSSVRVAKSPVEGKGVFATEPVGRGDTVLILDTSRVVDEERPLRPEEDEHEEHLAYLAGGKVVLLSEPERHLNHSCDPNAYLHTVDDEVTVVARRAIRAGEEVTIDYLINTHGGSSWRCRCGAHRCRGQLETSFFELPASFQREYLPLLEAWFIEEHPEEMERLKERLGDRE